MSENFYEKVHVPYWFQGGAEEYTAWCVRESAKRKREEKERKQRRCKALIASMFLVMGIISLYPWTGGLADFVVPEVVDYKFPEMTADEAKAALTQALVDTGNAKELTGELVYRNWKLTRSFSDLGRSAYPALAKDESVSGLRSTLSQVNSGMIGRLPNGPQKSEVLNKANELCSKDLDCSRLDDLSKANFDWSVLGGYLKYRYPLAMLIALPFFVIMMPVRGVRLLVELSQPLRPLVALASFPVSWKFYPHVDPREQMTRALHFVGLALTFLLSTAGGVAAQTVKKAAGEDKKSKDHSLQVDLRNSSFLTAGGPPDPNFQVRVSLYEKRWVIETVNSSSPRTDPKRFYSEVGGGVFLVRTTKTWLLATSYTSQNQANDRAFIAGGQFYRFGPKAVWAFPVIRYERGITGAHTNTFALAANPLFRPRAGGRFGIAPDVSLRKTLGKPLVWTAGVGFKLLPGKLRKNSVEVGALRNSQGLWSVRARSTLNFAF